jgi:transaldolase
MGTDDIRVAADAFRPAYDRTRALDGYACIEVSPALARDARGTVEEAHRLVNMVGRPTVMPKVPGTVEGLDAIEQLTYEGVNVNVTLLFSVDRYEDVMEAYLRGLERRAKEGKPVDHITSVASFFVSRVDTLVDRLLEERINAGVDEAVQRECRSLLGKAAIANARVAYQHFKRVFRSERFERLARQHGALVQRPLWASTSTKNPAYRDVLYVEELIGPDTVNTMPPQTIDAFRDHGRIRGTTVEDDVEAARALPQRLAAVGIDLTAVTRQLESEGIQAFAESFDQMLERIEEKSRAVLHGASR